MIQEPLQIMDVQNVNHLVGYLYGVIKGDGLITVEDWNRAVQETRAYDLRWPPPGPLSH